MKTVLLSIFFLLVFLSMRGVGFAQGLGSEITYKSTSTLGIYEVTLVIYRSCDDIALCGGTCASSCIQTLNLMGADSGYTTANYGSFTLTLQNVRDISNNIQNCAAAKNICTNRGCATPGTFSVGYERYEFKGMVNIGSTSGIPSNCCNVRFVSSLGSRNYIQTITAASSSIYQDAIVNRCLSVGINNSSPVFTNDPLYITCGSENIIYNNGLVDPDGDSITYAFAPALTAYNTSVTYLAPFSYNRPLTWTGNADAEFPAGIRCDPLTGDVMLTPGNASSQNFVGVVVFKCEQWRKIGGIYKLLGTVRRECATTVLANCPPNNSPRLITNPPIVSNPNAPQTFFETMAGRQLCFTITAKDTDVSLPTLSDTTILTWNQSLARYGATFLPVYAGNRALSGPREDTYQFCWTPPDSVASSVRHSFVVSAGDQRCPNNGKLSRAFSVKVWADPKPYISQKTIVCNKATLQYAYTNTPTTGMGIFWVIANDTSDITGSHGTTTYPALPLTLTFAKPGKYYIWMIGVGNNGAMYPIMSDSVSILSFDLKDSITVSPVTCYGLQNGTISSFAKKGTAPYLYKFNNDTVFRSLHSFNNLAAGNYVLTVKDATGCLATDTVGIPQPAELQTSLLFSMNPCDTTGVLSTTATGGTPAYLFSFNQNPFQASPALVVKTPGKYFVSIKDSNNCMHGDSMAIAFPKKLQQTLFFTKNICDSFGLLGSQISGGTAPFKYSINQQNPQSSGQFNIHQSGNYHVEVKDSNNCVHRDSTVITFPPQLKQTFLFTKNTCDTFGTLALQPSGGKAPYSFSLNQGTFQSASLYSIHESGNYQVVVKDSNNCSQSLALHFTLPLPFRFTFTKKEISCFLSRDGLIILSATGGNNQKAYRYTNLNTGETSSSGMFTNLDSGSVQFIIKDDSNCVLNHADRWMNPPPVKLTAIVGNSIVEVNQTQTYLTQHDSSLRTYEWKVTSGIILSGQGTDLITVKWNVSGTGLVEVTGTDSRQCKAVVSKSVIIGSVGMNELKQNLGIAIFPNPTRNLLSISVQYIPENNILRLYDLQGRLILQQELKLTQQLNLQELPQGIYMLKVGDWYGKVVRE